MYGARRIIIGTSGSPGSLQALRYAAGVAQEHDATLVPVLAWLPPGGDFADRSHPSGFLRQIWRDPVVAVPPPDLEHAAGHGLRGWTFPHRAHPRRTASAGHLG